MRGAWRIAPLFVLAVALVVLLAGSTPYARADDRSTDRLSAGTRVRVTAPAANLSKAVGSIASMSAEGIELRVADQDEPIVVPRSALAKLEVSRGRRSVGKSALKGTAIGAATGVVVGLVTIPFTCPHNANQWCDDDLPDSFYPVFNGILGASLGALIGAVSGARSGERWKEVPLDRLRVGIAPMRGRGVVVRVSISM